MNSRRISLPVAAVCFLAFACVTAPFFARAGDGPEPESISASFFVADRSGAPAGLYEFNYVVREEGVFATSVFYSGKEAVKEKKKGKPDVRSYLEMNPDRSWAKYTRWVKEGLNTREFKLFKYRRNIKLREACGSKAKVVEVGRYKKVYLIEAEHPYTAALLVDRKVPEKKFECVNTVTQKIGKAVIRLVGVSSKPVPGPEKEAPDSSGESERKDDSGKVDTGKIEFPEEKQEVASKQRTDSGQEPVKSGNGDKKPAASKTETVDLYEFKVEGDCGTASIWQNREGQFVRFSNDTHVFSRVER